ncbi:MAG: hypothetical protein JOZ90_01950 [Alphaproteobacteria bacterium]|nr:hypothetical protein [Alphaproteobacteria bacterium]MBV9370767.1 hypothetical protein [Alphaproteobacteria bacterium]MBV9899840.1 hypothetical protein [Alphaproteobacteria bacterium]
MGSKPIRIEDAGRRAERLALDEAARLRPNSWSSVEIRMIDLSEFGFRAACEARVRPGGSVSLEIPGLGPVEAQVEWQREGEFGARFFQSINLDACEWSVGEGQQALAQLLVQRAAAKRAGRSAVDRQLRTRILAALPMYKGGASR